MGRGMVMLLRDQRCRGAATTAPRSGELKEEEMLPDVRTIWNELEPLGRSWDHGEEVVW